MVPLLCTFKDQQYLSLLTNILVTRSMVLFKYGVQTTNLYCHHGYAAMLSLLLDTDLQHMFKGHITTYFVKFLNMLIYIIYQ